MRNNTIIFDTSQFLADTIDLTVEETGQYIILLCLQHKRGRLPISIIKTCLNGAECENVLRKFEQDENGLYYNKDLEESIEKRNRYIQSRKNNASKKVKGTDEQIKQEEQPNAEQAEQEQIEMQVSIEEEHKTEKQESCPYQQIKELFNNICVSYPKIKELTEKRKKALSARWRTTRDIKAFENVFKKAENSDFLKGNNKRNWAATFDWIINANNFVKISEGNYDNRGSSGTEREKYFFEEVK